MPPEMPPEAPPRKPGLRIPPLSRKGFDLSLFSLAGAEGPTIISVRINRRIEQRR
jgi:hypothetical protein